MDIKLICSGEDAKKHLEEIVSKVVKAYGENLEWTYKKYNDSYEADTTIDMSFEAIKPFFEKLINKYKTLSFYGTDIKDVRDEDKSANWYTVEKVKTITSKTGIKTLESRIGTYWN